MTFHCNIEKWYIVGIGPRPAQDFIRIFCFQYMYNYSELDLFSQKSWRTSLDNLQNVQCTILQNVNFIRNTVPCKANRRTRGGSWWWSNGTPSYSGDRRPPSGMFPWRRRRKSASNRRTPPDQVTPPSAVTFLCEE